MQDKTHTPCFLSTFYEEGKDAEFSEEDICFIAGALMEAGSDTTRMSLNEIVASAALFPDWVERARKELDEVAGNPPRRLPGFEDFDQLPLIRAAIKESMRWR